MVLYEDGQELLPRRPKRSGGKTDRPCSWVAGLNTVVSAFYYLKVMKVMILTAGAEDLEKAGTCRRCAKADHGYRVSRC